MPMVPMSGRYCGPLGPMFSFSSEHEEADDVLEDDLELAGVLDAQTRADEQAERRHEEDDQNRHHQEVGDDVARRAPGESLAPRARTGPTGRAIR